MRISFKLQFWLRWTDLGSHFWKSQEVTVAIIVSLYRYTELVL